MNRYELRYPPNFYHLFIFKDLFLIKQETRQQIDDSLKIEGLRF